jgi:NAD(P)H-dependent FMN reductase
LTDPSTPPVAQADFPDPDQLRLLIIIASTRPGRAGLPISEWVREEAVAHGGFSVAVADLAEIDLPMLDEPNHPRLHQYTLPHTKAWSATVAAADAFVFVMPEYNHGYPAPLKNAIDFLYREWQYKPVGLVSYGGVVGGSRAVQLLKPILAALKLVPMVEAVPITNFSSHLSEDSRFEATDGLNTGLDAMLTELRRWAIALRPLRAPVTG